MPTYMGRFPQDENFGCFVSLFEILLWTAVAEPDLPCHFFQLFCGEHDSLITLPQIQPSSIHYNAKHSKCNKNALFCVTFNGAINRKKWCSKSGWATAV